MEGLPIKQEVNVLFQQPPSSNPSCITIIYTLVTIRVAWSHKYTIFPILEESYEVDIIIPYFK